MARLSRALRSDFSFLSLEDAVSLHAIAIHRDGGAAELIDRGKLEAALAAPQATFEGRLLNSSVEELTAAYWHGICQAHAFLDGNKRLALLCAFAFLRKNRLDWTVTAKQSETMTMRIAKGSASKSDVAGFLEGKIFDRD